MRRPALSIVLLAVGLVVAGCAGSGHHSSRVVLAQWPVNEAQFRGEGGFLSPTRLAFGTWGSSGCPSVPYRMTLEGPHAIRLDMRSGSYRTVGRLGQKVLVAKAPAGGCRLLDHVSNEVVIAIDPKQIDVHHRLKVSLYFPLDKHPDVFTVAPL
jgi:hypothetical protein